MTASQASSGASPAPSASQGGAPAAPQSRGAPQDGSGRDPGNDIQKAWHEARAAREETNKLRDLFGKQAKDLDGFQEDRQAVQKMRDVFAPKKESAPDPVAGLEEQLDYYLETAMELKARGQSIPLTTNLAVQSFQTMIAQQKALAQQSEQIAELRALVQQANSPERTINDQAYGQMETFMQSSIDALYGKEPGAKAQIYDAAVRVIRANLQELQKQAPQEWDRVRRNPKDLQAIVNAAIKKLVPPRAYSILEDEQVRNTPMHEGELFQAWRELKAQKERMDPRQYRELSGDIRRSILEAQAKTRGRRR